MAISWLIPLLLRIIWVVIVLASSMMTLLMFAFADSPGAGKAAQKMIAPVVVITFVLLWLSSRLLLHATWWSVPAAYALATAPPFLVFLGYKLLMK